MNRNKECDTAGETPIEFEAPVEETIVEKQVNQDMITSDVEELEREIEMLRKSVEDTQNSYLRVMADFDNFRKRQREETARLTSCTREELILKLLPMVDNFDRTLQAAEAEHSYESLVEGVTLTLKHIREMLDKEGLKPIDAVGQEFNPELHEAVMRVEDGEHPDNTVVHELQKGYTQAGDVIRPARVTVAVSPED